MPAAGGYPAVGRGVGMDVSRTTTAAASVATSTSAGEARRFVRGRTRATPADPGYTRLVRGASFRRDDTAEDRPSRQRVPLRADDRHRDVRPSQGTAAGGAHAGHPRLRRGEPL